MQSASALKQSRGVSLVLLTGCIVLAAAYACLAARNYRATIAVSTLNPDSLRRAIALAPKDAAHQDLLCRTLLFDKQDPAAALPYCEQATELNSYQSAYWLHLALVYLQLGQQQKQEHAIRQAVTIDPTTPDVAWEAGNFFLVQGKIPEALHQFSVVIRGDPNMAGAAMDLCWRVLHNVSAMESVLPPDPEIYLQFVRMLIGKGEWQAAQQVWSALLQLNRPFDFHRALFCVDALLQNRDAATAAEVWKQLASRSPVLSRYVSPGNLIVNGDFAEEILNAGLDWHYVPQSGTTLTVDTAQFHIGNQSVLISYSETGGDAGLYQYVPVASNTQYTLSAWVKSEELKSANGPALSVTDAYNSTRYAMTPETVGTTPWHVVEANFRTGPDARLVVIRVVRDPANTRILGQFWVDNVSLTPSASAAVSK